MPPLYDRLRLARQSAGLTQRDLARLASIPESVISAYESARRLPSAGNIVCLAGALDVSADYLLGLSDTMRREPEAAE